MFISKHFPAYPGLRFEFISASLSVGSFSWGNFEHKDLYSFAVSLPHPEDGRTAVWSGDRGFSRLLYKMLPLDSVASRNQQKPRYGGLAAPDLLHTLS